MTDLPALDEKIQALITGARPRRLMVVGARAEALVSPAADAVELNVVPAAGAERAVAGHGQQDMAIVAVEPDEMPQEATAQLLSQLRDLFAKWVIVIADRDSPPAGLTRHEMVGLGFSLLGDACYADRVVHVYEFDIATYKTTPDWLNSRYWANPEMWDKYRW